MSPTNKAPLAAAAALAVGVVAIGLTAHFATMPPAPTSPAQASTDGLTWQRMVMLRGGRYVFSGGGAPPATYLTRQQDAAGAWSFSLVGPQTVTSATFGTLPPPPFTIAAYVDHALPATNPFEGKVLWSGPFQISVPHWGAASLPNVNMNIAPVQFVGPGADTPQPPYILMVTVAADGTTTLSIDGHAYPSGPLTGIKGGPLAVSPDLGEALVVRHAATAPEADCLAAWLSYRHHHPVHIGETIQVLAPPTPIVARLQVPTVPAPTVSEPSTVIYTSPTARTEGVGTKEDPMCPLWALWGLRWWTHDTLAPRPDPQWKANGPITVRMLPGHYRKEDLPADIRTVWKGLGSPWFVMVPGVIEPDQPGTVVVEGGLTVTGGTPESAGSNAGLIIRDLELTGGGLTITNCDRCQAINLYIHDVGQGLSLWQGANNVLIYGCDIQRVGAKLADGSWHGQGFYVQSSSPKVIACNVIGTVGDMIGQVYGSDHENGVVLADNVFVGPSHSNPTSCSLDVSSRHGGDHDNTIRDNIAYRVSLGIANQQANTGSSGTVAGNLLTGPSPVIEVGSGSPGVTVAPGQVAAGHTHDAVVIPVGVGRWNLAVWGSGDTSCVVDLGMVLKPGDRYTLRDPADLNGTPITTGTYTGPLWLPMAGLFRAMVLSVN